MMALAQVQPHVQPGQHVEVAAVVRTPLEHGRFNALFRLVDEAGVRFGPRLW